MPETYVVHLGNSKELMEVAEDSVAKRVLREHVRESLGVRNDDLLFAIINSMSLPVLIQYSFFNHCISFMIFSSHAVQDMLARLYYPFCSLFYISFACMYSEV